MCYSTTLDREARELERQYNRRLLEDTRTAYMHPDELEDGYGAVLYRRKTSAFARPYWPVIFNDKPEVIAPARWGFVPPHIKDEEEAKAYLKERVTFMSSLPWTGSALALLNGSTTLTTTARIKHSATGRRCRSNPNPNVPANTQL